MHVTPVIYELPFHLRENGSAGSRYLPWFREDIVLAFDFGRWLQSYLEKNLSSIDEAAYRQGKLFYYHRRDGAPVLLCKEFYAKTAAVYKDYIHRYFFNYQYGPTIAFIRRFDNTRFLGWHTTDIVKQDGQIHWPDNLFDDLRDISYKNAIGERTAVDADPQTANERTSPQLSDPNASLNDFEKHVFCCNTCQREETIYIEKGCNFYNIMETEYPCGRCGKESAVISSGDFIYRWDGDEWHPEVACIPLASGYCLDCRPFFESRVSDLMLECRCGQRP